MGDRGSTVEARPHSAALQGEPPMCRRGMGRPATRAASCFEADSGRTASGRVRLASARSCAPLRMRSITIGVSQLRSLTPEPILHRATERRCFCGMLVAATTDPRRAALARVPWLAVSDPKARSALHKKGQIDRAHQASPESAPLRSLSERLTLVAAVTSTLLRHGRLRAERNEPLVL